MSGDWISAAAIALAAAAGYKMVPTVPPSTDHAAPATFEARSEQRNVITAAISPASAKRPSGARLPCASMASSREDSPFAAAV
jgi:hypothetical protein